MNLHPSIHHQRTKTLIQPVPVFRPLRIVAAVLILACLAFAPRIRAQTTATVATLYNFDGTSFGAGGLNVHGSNPLAGLTQGDDGSFFGTTSSGGSKGIGTIFRFASDGTFTNLLDRQSNPLVQGSDGYLYGSTFIYDQVNNGATIFRFTAAGDFTTLYSGSEIGTTSSNLIEGSDGSFYGTASQGGQYSAGLVFKITPAGALTVLHSFMFNSDGSYPEGYAPMSRLVEGRDGNFYGTTSGGGIYTTLPGFGPVAASGTVFRITPDGELTILHRFESLVGNGRNDDGGVPMSDLVLGDDDSLYGTTQQGGANGTGTIFQISSGGMFTALYSFPNGGGGQFSGLSKARDGSLYGFAENGGANDRGMLFEITPTGVLTILHSFNESDGAFPAASPVQGNDGNFYGTTLYGGANGGGVIYKMVVTKPPTPAPSITSALVAGGTVGAAFSYQIVADASPTAYTATGLPGGLSADTATGLISGTPTVAGTFPVALSATNAAGGAGTSTLTLNIAPAPLPPAPVLPTVTLMATRPQVTVGSGESGRFTVALSEAQDHDVSVQITVKGNARNGTDYAPLKTSYKIKAGKTSKAIKVKPLASEAEVLAKRTVTLILQPGDGYTVGTTGKVKVKIINE